MQVAKIAVAAAPYAIDKPYDYRVPQPWQESLKVGMRVLIPFGRGNRLTEGFVLAQGTPSERALKPISAVLDDKPILQAESLRLAHWMRERYFCTFYDALRTIVPGGYWYHFRTRYEKAKPDAVGETEQEQRILDALQNGAQTGEQLQAICGADCSRSLERLRKRACIRLAMEAKQRIGDKNLRVVHLAAEAEAELAEWERRPKKAPMQYELLRFLRENGATVLPDLLYYTGASMASLRALEKRGWISYTTQEVFRVPHLERDAEAPPIVLNEEQEKAFAELAPLLEKGEGSLNLLQGVTGSGKTLVFLRMIQQTLALGKTALVLVPEIALTPQMMQRFSMYFGDEVAVLHSALRSSERYDQYKRIEQGRVKVVLGTRSAVFAPLDRLGLLVIDEEQEGSYLSEQSPCYDAREVAQFRCAQAGAVLLLGSATPAVTTSYRVRQGSGRLLCLHQRFNRSALPEVSVVDMRQELRQGNSSLLSLPLRKALEDVLLRGQQSILFLNRRGSSRLLLCGECGFVPQCPNCSVSMTYHSANGRLMCHYCGASERAMEDCPVCGGRMQPIGAGTQRVEAELAELFPKTPVLRMDADTVASAGGHEALLQRFERERIPILLGTQMVTKGLDFERVALVGVLDADLSLYVNHYQAAERTFDLLTQVVGRAGRGRIAGRAILQTFTPDNDVIVAAAAQDYESFYQAELRLRRQLAAPPFADLLTLTVSGTEESRVRQAAGQLRQELHGYSREQSAKLLGPVPARIARLNRRYRYQLTWVGQNDRATRGILAACLRHFYEKKENRGLQLSIRCNAESIKE